MDPVISSIAIHNRQNPFSCLVTSTKWVMLIYSIIAALGATALLLLCKAGQYPCSLSDLRIKVLYSLTMTASAIALTSALLWKISTKASTQLSDSSLSLKGSFDITKEVESRLIANTREEMLEREREERRARLTEEMENALLRATQEAQRIEQQGVRDTSHAEKEKRGALERERIRAEERERALFERSRARICEMEKRTRAYLSSLEYSEEEEIIRKRALICLTEDHLEEFNKWQSSLDETTKKAILNALEKGLQLAEKKIQQERRRLLFAKPPLSPAISTDRLTNGVHFITTDNKHLFIHKNLLERFGEVIALAPVTLFHSVYTVIREVLPLFPESAITLILQYYESISPLERTAEVPFSSRDISHLIDLCYDRTRRLEQLDSETLTSLSPLTDYFSPEISENCLYVLAERGLKENLSKTIEKLLTHWITTYQRAPIPTDDPQLSFFLRKLTFYSIPAAKSHLGFRHLKERQRRDLLELLSCQDKNPDYLLAYACALSSGLDGPSPKNHQKAKALLIAAEKLFTDSERPLPIALTFQLGLHFLEWPETAADPSSEKQRGVDLLESAVEANYPPALTQMAIYLTEGRLIIQNDSERRGFKLLQDAVQMHYSPALPYLADCLHYGKGVARNSVEALKYYQNAVPYGLPRALLQLGKFHNGGLAKLNRDATRAVEFFQKAAEEDDASALFYLARAHENGEGVQKKDLELALSLYQRSAELGDSDARTASERLSQRLNINEGRN